MEHKIAVIICYVGELPWYWPFFLHSCSFNKTIDFFIFGNLHFKHPLPGNVRLIPMSLADIEQLASSKIGFDVKITSGYKLCDYKPAYGLIFSDYVAGYDFWGQSDVDVIYGNIREFIDPAMLNANDFISMRHDYATGCMTFFRNNPLMNNLFRESKDYKKVFTSETHYCFDECNFAWNELKDKSIFDIETEIQSFTYVVKKAQQNNTIRAHFDFILIEGIPGKVKFDNGKIIYKNRYECILYHLILLKQFYKLSRVRYPLPDVYCISANKIYFPKKQIAPKTAT